MTWLIWFRVTAENQKVVIVSQWTSMLDVFVVHFRKLKIKCHLIAGNVSVKQRTAIVEDFNTNPKGPPVIISFNILSSFSFFFIPKAIQELYVLLGVVK